MTTHPLAIFLVFRNDKDLAERTLATIYNNLNREFYLYVVDDASDDDTATTIQSVIEHYSHDQTFFYENPTELGRERSIKELLQLVESPILWMPQSVDDTLTDLRNLSHLLQTPNPVQLDQHELKSRELSAPLVDVKQDEITAEWINSVELDGVEKIGEDPGTSDEVNVISVSEELATPEVLLLDEIDFNEDDTADFDGVIGEVRPMGSTKRQKLEKLGVSPEIAEKVSTPPPKSARDMLKFKSSLRKNTISMPEKPSDVVKKVFPEVERLVNDGENLFALKTIEKALGDNPNDAGLLHLKVKILEFMRRYVEAAEIKHQLKMGGPGITRPKIRREPVLIVDPTEDPGVAVVVDEEEHVEEEQEEEVREQGEEEQGEEGREQGEVASTHPIEASVPKPDKYDPKPRISIVIPTTINGKGLLERTLISLSNKADKSDRELIIVDNASLDDTYDYLAQLKREGFMQIRVITNPVNYGFARAANQGIEIARGEYVLLMHNDVTIMNDAPGKLADILDIHPEVTTLGPLAEVALNDEQRRKSVDPTATVIKKTRYIDSFCMMFRRSKVRKFDERYGLAYFEDLDYCTTDNNKGGVVAIAMGVKVEHLGGATTNAVGRELYSQAYWKNASEFEKKWDALPTPAPFTDNDSAIERLCMISELLNPFCPEQHLLNMAGELMTSELRNEILERNYNPNFQVPLIRLMLAMDMRDVARVLEDNLDPNDLDESLLQILIEFYYQKHIYSRSLKYLAKVADSLKPFSFKLLELKVYMGTRDYDKATSLLSELIKIMPAHPELFKITSDIHRANGSTVDADEFYSLAHQSDPYSFK